MPGRLNITNNKERIRKWAKQREGQPAIYRKQGAEEELRIDFPGKHHQKLHDITWNEFFHKLDEKGLAFEFEEETEDGKTSKFNQFVRRG